MKNLLIIILILNGIIYSQVPTKNHSKMDLSCQSCHSCLVPTKDDPCLINCPRENMETIYQKASTTKEIIEIDKLTKTYEPVYFSHRIHAEMAEMSGGCASCHHYNTSGPIQKCSSCHSESRQREDKSIPDLQAAYHRQCIDCHREWSGSTDCLYCHEKKSDNKQLTQKLRMERIRGKSHPELKEPEKVVYSTDAKEGKLVTFYHNEHTNLFKLDCASCHKNDNCVRCHSVDKKETKLVSKINFPFEEQHKDCISCHKNDDCTSCHMNNEAKPFNHLSSTGWALNKFHINLDCLSCHKSTPRFNNLNRDCNSCHKEFLAGNFNHKATGLILDDIHLDFECGDCHTNNNFAVKTNCTSCHDDDYIYPKLKPGSLISIKSKK